jgi:hypothetical protein
MPIGINNLELHGFYSNSELFKTIQKNYKFFVTFWDDDQFANRSTVKGLAVLDETGSMPIIDHWHVKSISLPQYSFSKEVVKYGPIAKSYPVMNDFNGLDIEVEFEEDEWGTIAYFINYLQRKIIRKDGTYRSQLNNRIDNMVVLTEDDMGVPINIFWYKKLFFQNVTPPTFDYSGNDSIKYTITFGADLVKFLPVKALAKEKLKTEVLGKILGV